MNDKIMTAYEKLNQADRDSLTVLFLLGVGGMEEMLHKAYELSRRVRAAHGGRNVDSVTAVRLKRLEEFRDELAKELNRKDGLKVGVGEDRGANRLGDGSSKEQGWN